MSTIIYYFPKELYKNFILSDDVERSHLIDLLSIYSKYNFHNLTKDHTIFFEWKKIITQNNDPLNVIAQCMIMRELVILLLENPFKNLYACDRYIDFITNLLIENEYKYKSKKITSSFFKQSKLKDPSKIITDYL